MSRWVVQSSSTNLGHRNPGFLVSQCFGISLIDFRITNDKREQQTQQTHNWPSVVSNSPYAKLQNGSWWPDFPKDWPFFVPDSGHRRPQVYFCIKTAEQRPVASNHFEPCGIPCHANPISSGYVSCKARESWYFWCRNANQKDSWSSQLLSPFVFLTSCSFYFLIHLQDIFIIFHHLSRHHLIPSCGKCSFRASTSSAMHHTRVRRLKSGSMATTCSSLTWVEVQVLCETCLHMLHMLHLFLPCKFRHIYQWIWHFKMREINELWMPKESEMRCSWAMPG